MNIKMKIKKGDTVKVAAGKDKGKTGQVIQVFPKLNRLVVEGANIAHKHIRSRRRGDSGQKVEYSAPLSAANVRLVCPKCNQATRVGFQTHTDPDGKTTKVRACKKCGEAIE